MTDNFEDKTSEELEEVHQWFKEQGWSENAELVAEELANRDDSENDSEVAEDKVATLQEKYEWFEGQGWEENAEKVAEEMARRDIDHPAVEELSEDSEDSELTSVAHLSGSTYSGA